MNNQDETPTLVLDLDQSLMQSALLEAADFLDLLRRHPQLHPECQVLARRSALRFRYFLHHCREAPRATMFELRALDSHHQELASSLRQAPAHAHSLRQAAQDRET